MQHVGPAYCFLHHNIQAMPTDYNYECRRDCRAGCLDSEIAVRPTQSINNLDVKGQVSTFYAESVVLRTAPLTPVLEPMEGALRCQVGWYITRIMWWRN